MHHLLSTVVARSKALPSLPFALDCKSRAMHSGRHHPFKWIRNTLACTMMLYNTCGRILNIIFLEIMWSCQVGQAAYHLFHHHTNNTQIAYGIVTLGGERS